MSQHLDILGRQVQEGDTVAYTHHNSLMVGRIGKITEKQIRVFPISNEWIDRYRNTSGYLKYSTQCVLVGGPDLTAWILKNG